MAEYMEMLGKDQENKFEAVAEGNHLSDTTSPLHHYPVYIRDILSGLQSLQSQR